MSTKYLGRSVIELGRSTSNKFERNQIARRNRRVRLDADGEPIIARHYEYAELRDHLNPLRRWLDANVGRPWSVVYSEFCKKNPRNTLQGYHVWTHLQYYVKGSGGRENMYSHYNPWDYFIDKNNILRKSPPRKYDPFPYEQSAQVESWLASRRITFEFGAWYWVKCWWQEQTTKNRKGEVIRLEPLIRRMRVAGRMSNEEVTYWNSLDQRVRNRFYVDPTKLT